MKTNLCSLYYSRRGLKTSPSVFKGNQMELKVGRVIPLQNSLGDKPISYSRKKNDFLEWIEGYKKSLNDKLEKAIEQNKSSQALLLTGKIVVCNDIELAYLKLK